jgi:hypothetical protein
LREVSEPAESESWVKGREKEEERIPARNFMSQDMKV